MNHILTFTVSSAGVYFANGDICLEQVCVRESVCVDLCVCADIRVGQVCE
jgi:hypothetical protein